VERAVSGNTVIIPFRIDEVEATGAMAYFLGTEHWLDALTPPLESHIAGLAGTVKALIGSTLERPEAPETEPDPEPEVEEPVEDPTPEPTPEPPTVEPEPEPEEKPKKKRRRRKK